MWIYVPCYAWHSCQFLLSSPRTFLQFEFKFVKPQTTARTGKHTFWSIWIDLDFSSWKPEPNNIILFVRSFWRQLHPCPQNHASWPFCIVHTSRPHHLHLHRTDFKSKPPNPHKVSPWLTFGPHELLHARSSLYSFKLWLTDSRYAIGTHIFGSAIPNHAKIFPLS